MSRIIWSFLGIGCPIVVAAVFGAVTIRQFVFICLAIVAANLVGFAEGVREQ